MFYRDLVHFEPIQSVIHLRDADQSEEARRLVESYVVSDRMAGQLAAVVIPQLQFERVVDNRGVLIVGNYGTGKSHLMSVISAVAEHGDAISGISNDRVRSAAEQIAGKFKVLRVELGASEATLRDIIVRELEAALSNWGIAFTFPPATQITNNKDAIISAMGLFRERFPNHGLLLVIDELLDFIRARNDQEKILDLGFLRELGEVVADTRFRFMAGLQETLFDSPKFQFVAESLRRVKDRFEQITIAREDIAFVVSNRLLKKTDEQKGWIESHLAKFTPLYGGMAERLSEYASLFPIHPAYVATFEKVYVAEKREVLRTFSDAIASLLDSEVPENQPGLISYDHYWQILVGNPSMRTYPEIAEVLDKEGVVEGRIDHAYTRPTLKPMATRIIRALGVHRLTTDDINARLGVTPEELRDDLCLYVETPVRTAEFLDGQVRVALKAILQTVSGQYISHNEGNDQYYLDVKKDTDFEAVIAEKGQALSDDELNRYFFEVLSQMLGKDISAAHVPQHRIWQYEVPWEAKRVNRPGYFFLGAMDERATAKPPRDFYLYFLPPLLSREPQDKKSEDEVIFHLTKLGPDFDERLRRYSGARALESTSASHRQQYSAKAKEAGGQFEKWLNAHYADLLQIRHQGVSQPLREALGGATSTAGKTLDDVIRLIAASKLAPQFEHEYFDYPAFTRLTQFVSESARPATAMEAIRVIAGGQRTAQGTAVLDALGLLGSDGQIRPAGSRYAQRLLEALNAKPEGHVVNRSEVIALVAGGVAQPVEKDIFFKMEPDWIAVLLVALVHAGRITLTLAKETLDASSIERTRLMAIEDLTNFQYFAKPKQPPIAVWEEIFTGLGLQAARVRDEATREDAVKQLVDVVARESERIAQLQSRIGQGLKLWNEPIFTDNFRIESVKGAVVGTNLPDVPFSSTTLLADIRGYKRFIEEIAKYHSPGRLNNLKYDTGQVAEAATFRATATRAERSIDAVTRLQPLTEYLAGAEGALPAEHPWSAKAEQTKKDVINSIRRFGETESAIDVASLRRSLEALKSDYVTLYEEEHRHATLDKDGQLRRQRVQLDQRVAGLKSLAQIDLVSRTDLEGWEKAINGLPTCSSFHRGLLTESPVCVCKFRPNGQRAAMSATQRLKDLDERLDTILSNWRRALRDNLQSDAARQSLSNMSLTERTPIDRFFAQSDDDPTVPEGFLKTAKAALQGINALNIDQFQLLNALSAGGFPCTVDEFKRRFDSFMGGELRGKHAPTTRVMLKGD